MRHENAADRVRRRIAEWVKEHGHGSRKRIAQNVKGLYGKDRSSSWVTDIVDGPDDGGQDLRLRDLDGVADAMGIPPGDLVRHDYNTYAEVSPSELRLLKFYRSLPEMARHHFIGYFDYISGIVFKQLDQQAEERDRRTAEAKRQRAALDRVDRKRRA